MKKLFIHIGYPKTATTTFQKYLFPNHNELRNISDQELKNIDNIFYSRENDLKRNISINKKYLKSIIEPDKKYIYSNESLLSFSLFFRFNPKPYIWTLDPISIARKLKYYFKDTEVFDDVKIIITIRKQEELLKSMYSQVYNLVYKHFKETNSFIKFLDYALLRKDNGFIIDTLYYYDIVKSYEELFGKNNIKILVYEQLFSNKDKFIKSLTDYMNINFNHAKKLIVDKKENATNKHLNIYSSDTRDLVSYLRYYKNKYINRSLKISGTKLYKLLTTIKIKGKKIDVNIPQQHKEKIKFLFNENNRALDKEFNLDLKKHGYYD
jgi:hypothetical protein